MLKRRSAQSIAEWGLMIALVVVVSMVALMAFAPVMKGTWVRLNNSMTAGSGQQVTP